VGEDRGQVFLMGPARVAGLIREAGRGFPDSGCFHRAGIIVKHRVCWRIG
jgi:hypothetical protein